MAAAAVPFIIRGVSAISGALLAAHTARLHDAANENAALDALIPAFDADLQAVVNAYNSGNDPQDCINALYAIDSNAYQYLRAQVGKPGTAWGGPSTGAIGLNINPTYPAPCNKACTAGCCVYLNDLRPAIFGRAGVNFGLIEAIQKGGGAVHVPAVAPPPNKAYGNYQRPSYTLQLVKPSGLSLDSSVLETSGSGASFTVQAGQSNVPFVSSLAKVSTTTILAVVGALIVVITALFGQNALRVNR